MSTKVPQVKWIVFRSVNCYWISSMSVCFFLSCGNFRTWTACFLILCNLQTAVLAAATLLFLIALPMVNCKRRNALRIEELDEYYDQGKIDNGMNQAMNAYPRGDLPRKKPQYSQKEVCDMLSTVIKKYHCPIPAECNNVKEICLLGHCGCNSPLLGYSPCTKCIL